MRETWRELAEQLRSSSAYRKLLSGSPAATGLSVEAAAWACSLLAEDLERSTLIVVPRESAAVVWNSVARLFGHAAEFFSAPSLTPYQSKSSVLSVSASEVVALDRVLCGEVRTLITTAAGLFRRLPGRDELAEQVLEIRPSARFEFDELVARIAEMGFERVDLVNDIGQFALRGGIVDLFPAGELEPVRIDFFGDEVESVRSFDARDQRSRRELRELRVRPLSLFPSGVGAMADLAKFLIDELPKDALSLESSDRLTALGRGVTFPGWEQLLPAMASSALDLKSWMGSDADVIAFEPREIEAEVESHASRLKSEWRRTLSDGELGLPPQRILQTQERVLGLLEAPRVAIATSSELPAAADFGTRRTDLYHGQLARFPMEVQSARARGERVILVAPEPHRGRLETFCESYGLELGRQDGGGGLEIVAGELTRGFRIDEVAVSLYSEDQLFRRIAPRRRRRQGSVFFTGLRDLKAGDFVVHHDHGIGQFIGLRAVSGERQSDDHIPAPLRSEISGTSGPGVELLEIKYSNGRTLLLPPSGLDRLQRYLGFEGVAPKLDRLGGTSWIRKKQKVKVGMRRMAGDLLKLYAERQVARAPKMPEDTDLQVQFDAAFDYEPTRDQVEAVATVKGDLESERPMDRLLCGDVGFGKTEVAMRAAFKVVDSGFQVAVLAPTTILADQHLETFRRRFAGFPIEVDVVSRFRTNEEVSDVRSRLADGRIDILIGTHRLLSRDLEFHNLGLLVVDEEQRFGVAQKERLRKLKKNVHVLAMTATPVPRTLQLSLAGVRDLSTIETPPRDRMSVETAILPFSRELVLEAIEYELGRQGQVYYVYNRVESIAEMAEQLREIVPKARLVIGHGQLGEGELAHRMHAFTAGEYDVLLATTIIENGIDIPNVNTILVHRADRFGLAQLYQLRGRVGRSRRLAYCYLLTPLDRVMSQTSRKRLEAIREFTELGAGFRVAARDLEIRGAGDLLGAEQSGHISAVGLETYLKMLEETVRELQGKPVAAGFSVAIELPVEWTIPEDYVPQQNLRLELYREIATGDQASNEMLEELSDRFGEPPPEVHRLLEVASLKRLAETLLVQSISAKSGALMIRFRQDTKVAADDLIRFVGERADVSFSPSGVLTWNGVPADQLVKRARQALEEVGRRE